MSNADERAHWIKEYRINAARMRAIANSVRNPAKREQFEQIAVNRITGPMPRKQPLAATGVEHDQQQQDGSSRARICSVFETFRVRHRPHSNCDDPSPRVLV